MRRPRQAFERAIALDSALPLARLGLGLAKIRAGDLESGSRELEIAVALDPNDSLLRSYLGKAYSEERRNPLDGEQYVIAKQLDPNDPTPWFYNAIRLQTINRPVEALHELEKSIELNDNRAVYRSRLLLDEDIAVRETSLARIYNDLGFEQVARVEATKSLNQDPANYSAHRFLSDTYAGLPRHEIARASELLQAQLLQPVNINPVQPSLPLTDFNVAAGAGPAEGGIQRVHPAVCAQRRPAHRDRHRRQQRYLRRRGRGDHARRPRIPCCWAVRRSTPMAFANKTTATRTTWLTPTYRSRSRQSSIFRPEYRYRDTDQGVISS